MNDWPKMKFYNVISSSKVILTKNNDWEIFFFYDWEITMTE